jgi:hypothetical protein
MLLVTPVCRVESLAHAFRCAPLALVHSPDLPCALRVQLLLRAPPPVLADSPALPLLY